MRQKISDDSFFVAAAARFNDLIYFAIKDRKLAESEVEHSRFIAFDRGELAHMGDRNWSTVDMCVVKQPVEKLVAIGEDGEVFTYVGGETGAEVIEPPPIVLRAVEAIAGRAYACGMKRQVYRRGNEADWTAMHAPPPGPDENAGFEAIDGFDADEIYAAGWGGEIWQWNGADWLHRVSPTNLILTGVACSENGDVYVCGQTGTLLRGRRDDWVLVDVGDVTDDFWDLIWYGGQLYLASMTMLFVLVEDGLVPVDFGHDIPGTCGSLTTAEGVLWSVGSDDVFSFDGTAWTRED